jgi:predicted transcriptional regulator of viral defense system
MSTTAPQVFTTQQAPALLRGSALRYARSKGTVAQVKRGLYLNSAANLPADPYALLHRGFPSPVVSHHSALELHGYAYSHRNVHTAFTDTDQRPFQFQGYTFVAVAFPKILRDKKLTRTETAKVFRLGQQLTATSLERTLVDCLARPDLSGGLEEVWRGFDSASADLDPERLCRYVVLLENKTLAGLVGLLLDQLSVHVSKKSRELLRRHSPVTPHYAGAARGEGTLVKDWNVIVPRSLAERSWEETSDHPPITFRTYEGEKVRRTKAKNRRDILRASPAQKLAMQHTHSLVGYNKDDFKRPLDLSRAAAGFL